ncbi:hypothetical protein EYZ11_008728 [Aspergillus tanneri]|uniref:Ketosynthase family 3 (KS3) domain-containing protein n=1 Tax=Aspergillus tanneri TaxID=1220188 RepID=A0A4S3J9Q4_9EURO|nr:hypothetical protein EYZ11_008728 [Aspergillus tanneri]
MSMLGLLAPDGNCKTFDASANGFARGESVCALYLKRLDHAIRDGNPIRAVIRACDGNADGGDGSRTFGTPNPKTQETLIRQTYASAGLPLAETKVIELHGTRTVVGDPLERSAITKCFGGDEKVYIGSVNQVLKSLEHPPEWTFEGLLLADGADKNLFSPTDRSQPICAAVQVAYVDALVA